jgi:RNA polymerase sigma factor (sigma-70 family)
MSERNLLGRARNGDQEAIAELYRDHVGAALKYARAIAPSLADAEDLVAESFAQVITQLALAKGPETSFRAYLFTTMRHRLYSSNSREIAVADDAVLDKPFSDRGTDERADRELLRTAFDALTPQEQEVLLLLDVHELRPAEVASRLGLRASALSMRAARARGALAEAFLVAHLQPGADAQCESVRRNLGRYVRGTLSGTRSRFVRDHLLECDSCTAAMAELTEVNRALRAIPIFALPIASPHGWRAALGQLRPKSRS